MPEETIAEDVQATPETVKAELPEWAQKELEKARGEAAERRVKLREVESQLKELQPLAEQFRQQTEAQKSEEQKLRDQLEAMKAQTETAVAAAEQAKKEAKLTTLASKAGVDADLVALLDLSKLDLDDEEATLNTLKKLITTRSTGGGSSNPEDKSGGIESPADWYKNHTGRRTSLFGG